MEKSRPPPNGEGKRAGKRAIVPRGLGGGLGGGGVLP